MHDLGHGPYSHLFDRGVIPALLTLKGRTKADIGYWEHEKASGMLFDHIVDKCEIDIEQDGIDQKLVKALIDGKIPKEYKDHKRWMFEIVSNKRNSFDVDKLDYLCRDDYHCGLTQ